MSMVRTDRLTTALQFASRHGVVVLLVLSGSLNILLSARVSSEGARISAVVPVGTRVPALAGVSARGTLVVSFPSSLPVLLYYFSPTCGWCKRNWNNVMALADAAKGGYRLVALSTVPSIDGELEALLPGFEVVWGIDEQVMRAYQLGGTPATILLSPEGRVVHFWTGAFQGRVASEIEARFRTALPGVSR